MQLAKLSACERSDFLLHQRIKNRKSGIKNPLAQVGLEPTASLVLSESGLPIAYQAAQEGTPRAWKWFTGNLLPRMHVRKESALCMALRFFIAGALSHSSIAKMDDCG